MITITHYDEKEDKYTKQIILTVLDGVKWSGADDNAGRLLEFQILYNPRKPDIQKYKFACGDKVTFEENGKILFEGYIEKHIYDTDEDTISVFCRDLISYLKRSTFVGRAYGTLTEIAEKICATFGIQSGIKSDDTQIFSFAGDKKRSYFDVIFEACQKVYRECYLYIENNTLKVQSLQISDNSNITATLVIGKNIRESLFSEDIGELVTSINVLDNKSRIKQIITDPKLRKKYGLFQSVYNYNTDDKSKLPTQDELRKKIKCEAKIIANNDNNCVTGNFVYVKEPYNNIVGMFKIISDEHIIGADSYMVLYLEYNI